MRTILYVFAGREPNLRIGIPFYRRLLQENPDLTVDIWDLCRSPEDSRYLRSLEQDDRFRVRTEFSRLPTSQGQTAVWREYSKPDYADCVLLKADDDLVFIETAGIPGFIQAAVDNPTAVISALTVNNGASSPLIPGIWDIFESMDIPLLDVHLHGEFAERCHRWFAQNWESLVGQPASLVPASSWVSINFLATSHQVVCDIADLIGTRSPKQIADRIFPRRNARGRLIGQRVGDEGAANMLDRLIYTGAVCSHFSFGPQLMSSSTQDELRKLYASIAQQYLAAEIPAVA